MIDAVEASDEPFVGASSIPASFPVVAPQISDTPIAAPVVAPAASAVPFTAPLVAPAEIAVPFVALLLAPAAIAVPPAAHSFLLPHTLFPSWLRSLLPLLPLPPVRVPLGRP